MSPTRKLALLLILLPLGSAGCSESHDPPARGADRSVASLDRPIPSTEPASPITESPVTAAVTADLPAEGLVPLSSDTPAEPASDTLAKAESDTPAEAATDTPGSPPLKLDTPATGPNAPISLAVRKTPLFQVAWTERVDHLPKLRDSAKYIARYGDRGLDNVWGFPWNGYQQGMPYNVVDKTTPMVKVPCTPLWGGKPYTIEARVPANPMIENPVDCHLLILSPDDGKLWEFWQASRESNGTWKSNGGVAWDLAKSPHEQRPEGRDSADAAGLPILPGVICYDEVARAAAQRNGTIGHAIRVAYPNNANAPGWYKLPAHATPNNFDANPWAVPMGARIRVRRDLDLSRFSKTNQVILRTLQVYGGICADGTGRTEGWSIQGHPDPRWDADDLMQLREVPTTDLEIVDDGLWGPAWKVHVSPGPYRVGQPITVKAELIQPPPAISVLGARPAFKAPSGKEETCTPWIIDLSAKSKSGETRFIPSEAGTYQLGWQSWSGENHGRKAPQPVAIKVRP